VSQPNQTGDRLKVALCTREYPPEAYDGARLGPRNDALALLGS